jgi:DNA polymerase-1
MSGSLLAVDTPWLLYRSHFGLPRSIKGADGAPVGALLGTVNTILGLVQWCSPRAVVCCLGAEQADYRVALYPPYHAHRDPMPPELRAQWERAPALLEALGWSVAADDALEADDLLWSYSRVEGAAGGDTLICSGDRDLFQTVDAHTRVVELRRDGPPGTIDAAGVEQRSGVTPTPPTDCRAPRESAPRPPPRCCANTTHSRASSQPRISCGPASPPHCGNRPTSCARSARSRRCRTFP